MSDATFSWTFDAGALSAAIRSLDQALQSHIKSLSYENSVADNRSISLDADGQDESMLMRPAIRKRKSTLSTASTGGGDGEGAPAIVKRADKVGEELKLTTAH